MRAKHFLREDMTAGYGDEPPWTVGETRTVEGELVMCRWGFHASRTWLDALQHAPGPVATIIDLRGIGERKDGKVVARTKTLLQAVDVSRELRLFACKCAERVLLRERKAGREPDKRVWELLEVSRRYAVGEATEEELQAAYDAAHKMEYYAAYNAARYTALKSADYAAYKAAAYGTTYEVKWQRRVLARMINDAMRRAA